ncbi:sialidase family protein [Saccharospirillum salsuginis]|uniref:exo-alpha-sialidase n=1 Tax=Saccharospirillum salsuginis TaxID=418750 RepID=A0A918K7J0_9GAMM|nr:sialidase family protein [Saccharospirillum salsuginis]GGX52348.1 hypothetical protein GCM10007392_19600 [Saccharospirillum salsuginis]
MVMGSHVSAPGAVKLKRNTEYYLDRVVVGQSSDGTDYHSEPRVVEMKDGRLLCVHQRAQLHDDNTTRIVYRTSADRGKTWSADTTLYDPASGYAGRNPGLCLDPTTGRIIVFAREYNSGTAQVDLVYMYSDDNAATWNSPTSIMGLFGAEPVAVPFGKGVETAQGLMQIFYASDKIWALFSTDNGQSWGGLVTIHDNQQASATFSESVPVRIDNNRVVLCVRDGDNPERFYFFRTTDGGATWAGVQFGTWTGQAINTPTPLTGIRHENDVYLSWGARSPDWNLYLVKASAEYFFQAPDDVIANATRVKLIKSEASGGGAASDAEFGYSDLAVLSGIQHTVLVTWYDTKDDATVTDTNVYAMSAPRVSA